MSNLISWDHQRAFLAVIEEGSLSGAARRLGVSQPTIRGWIAALEEALDTRLFSRSVNGLTPTESARALVEPARAMSLASDVFVRAATAAPGEIAGTVRVSVSETMGIEVIPPMLVPLRRKHPRLTVELFVTNKPADLLAQEVDIAVRTFAPGQDALIARKVGTIPLGFFASIDYLERRGWPETMADLAGHDILGPDRSAVDLRLGNAAVPDLRPARYALRTDCHPARIAAVRAGLGITVMQVPIGSGDPGLRRLFPDTVVTSMDTWIVAHEDLRSVAKVGAVFDHLVSAFIDFIGGHGKPAGRGSGLP
ncbi:LysR family transcriptional regulator [Nitratireductor soli]|uniref:LysR family transcriptional regulator n=1 Tax=Nitratireductor soli TaxID=1670619 RepID=UPI00065DF087|nr:LysR family transcriptional regulator [Nitratireductor soli]